MTYTYHGSYTNHANYGEHLSDIQILMHYIWGYSGLSDIVSSVEYTSREEANNVLNLMKQYIKVHGFINLRNVAGMMNKVIVGPDISIQDCLIWTDLSDSYVDPIIDFKDTESYCICLSDPKLRELKEED